MATLLKWMGMGGGGAKSVNSNEWLNSLSNNERYFGFENFGNTCYCNSVLQALYFCRPFRECIQNYTFPIGEIDASRTGTASLTNSAANINGKADPAGTKDDVSAVAASITTNGHATLAGPRGRPTSPVLKPSGASNGKGKQEDEENLLTALQNLFLKIGQQKKRTGIIAPLHFVNRLKKENELFRSSMDQDAHEFLNYTLNAIAEILMRHKSEYLELLRRSGADPQKPPDQIPFTSWIHDLFEGQLTNETKCRTCETVTNREETFLDLSVDIEHHSSLTSCLRNFSTSETLCSKNKFYCDNCCSLQEADKRMKIKKLPNILLIHLKRFKYQEKLQRYIKLAYRVVFPMELKLFNTSDDAEDSDRLYNLNAVIVHIGGGPYHGHYVTLVKSFDRWLLFDDDAVEPVDETDLRRYFGDSASPGTGYILLYERAGFDSGSIVRAMRAAAGSAAPAADLPPDHADAESAPDGPSPTPGAAAPSPMPSQTDSLPHHLHQPPPPGSPAPTATSPEPVAPASVAAPPAGRENGGGNGLGGGTGFFRSGGGNGSSSGGNGGERRVLGKRKSKADVAAAAAAAAAAAGVGAPDMPVGAQATVAAAVAAAAAASSGASGAPSSSSSSAGGSAGASAPATGGRSTWFQKKRSSAA
ncbi:hypothetical protein DFJ73DRAFT_956578 [Zopfochytrium polystomum]|nr:hypothetical protein DFJ73DRAFT_956578 [Zopfochytrium polystomum]